jgi:hypothetical protein
MRKLLRKEHRGGKITCLQHTRILLSGPESMALMLEPTKTIRDDNPFSGETPINPEKRNGRGLAEIEDRD